MVLYRYLKELLEVNMKFTPELDVKIKEYKKLNPAFKRDWTGMKKRGENL